MTRRLTCHCGAVELAVTLAEPLEEAIRCDCSLCRRRGAAMLAVRLEDLTVVRGAENLTLYTFNTHVAQHWFCKTCGCYTHHRRRSDPAFCGVNMGGLEGVSPRDYEPITWVDGVNHPSDDT